MDAIRYYPHTTTIPTQYRTCEVDMTGVGNALIQ